MNTDQQNKVIRERMLQNGFRAEGTGGNVEAWRRDLESPKGAYLLICAGDGYLYDDPEADCWSTEWYGADGEQVGGASGMTLDQALCNEFPL